jgi:hypothetical protein
VNFVIQHPNFDSLSRGNDTLLARARQVADAVEPVSGEIARRLGAMGDHAPRRGAVRRPVG